MAGAWMALRSARRSRESYPQPAAIFNGLSGQQRPLPHHQRLPVPSNNKIQLSLRDVVGPRVGVVRQGPQVSGRAWAHGGRSVRTSRRGPWGSDQRTGALVRREPGFISGMKLRNGAGGAIGYVSNGGMAHGWPYNSAGRAPAGPQAASGVASLRASAEELQHVATGSSGRGRC